MQANRKHSDKSYTSSSRSVQEFYDNSNVFITGASGFVGKAVVEKLLRSCDGIKNIYILLRPKRNQSIEIRFESYLKNKAFDRVRKIDSEVLDKIKFISGDMTQSKLGMSTENYEFMRNEINIVLNVAASVNMNDSLDKALNLNALGTKRVLDLAEAMPHLKSLVHVSTAYSNPYLRDVPEKVCKIDLPDKWYLQNIDDPSIKQILEKELHKYPNTYTISKNIAEQIVQDYSANLPICIVRPSIITSSYMEPYEGWINGISTVAVFALGIKFGIFGSLRADKDCVLDVMPVDIVANSIIVAASLNSRNNFKIYNCTSGSINPIKIGSYFECLKKHTNYEGVIRNRPFVNPSFIGHKLHRLFLNHLPCLILDLVRWICCRKPIYMRKSSKFLQGADVLEFFTKNEWNFEAENFKNLIQYAKEQGGNFDCDIEKLQWDDFIRKSVNGMDKFLLGSR